MSPRNYLEIDFEEHIEEQLQQSGYQSSSPNEYDKKLCLIPSKLIEFIKETQPKKLDKLTQQYGSDTTSKLTNWISKQIESRRGGPHHLDSKPRIISVLLSWCILI